MKIKRNIKQWMGCSAVLLSLSATVAEAGISLKMTDSDSYMRDGAKVKVVRFAPEFTHSGTLSLPAAGDASILVPMGKVEIDGKVSFTEGSMPTAGDVHYTLSYKNGNFNDIVNIISQRVKDIKQQYGLEYSMEYTTYDMLTSYEYSHYFDVRSNESIALLALEPFINLREGHPAKKALQEAHAALVETLESRAVLSAVLSAAAKECKRDWREKYDEYYYENRDAIEDDLYHSIDEFVYNPDYKYLFERGFQTAVAFFEDMGNIECPNYRISKSYAEVLEDNYPELHQFGPQLLQYMCVVVDADNPSTYINTAVWSTWLSEVQGKQEKGAKLTKADKTVLSVFSAEQSRLQKVVADYEYSVRAALAAMSRVEYSEEREKPQPDPVTKEVPKKPQTPVMPSPPPTDRDDADSKTDVDIPNDVFSDTPINNCCFDSIPQLLPDTDDLRQLMLDCFIYEPGKLGEILLFVRNKERAERVSVGENALLKRWLRQYENKLEKISRLKDLPENDGVREQTELELAFNPEYNKVVDSIRHDYLMPGYNALLDADYYHCNEIRSLINQINKKTRIFDGRKLKPINNGNDALRNFLEKAF